MPPKQKTEAQLEKDKQEIVSAALEIISRQGLEALSMRKLASQLHMSSANIYNYFYNKDEIYLHILITGFDLLYSNLSDAIAGCENPFEQMEQCVRTYIQFGLHYSSYYELMFSTRDPKSLDYVGTPVEKLAQKEKDDSIRSLTLFNSVVSRCLPAKSEDEVFISATQIICELHGCINLYHSNVLKEIGAKIEDVSEYIVLHIVSNLKNQAL